MSADRIARRQQDHIGGRRLDFGRECARQPRDQPGPASPSRARPSTAVGALNCAHACSPSDAKQSPRSRPCFTMAPHDSPRDRLIVGNQHSQHCHGANVIIRAYAKRSRPMHLADPSSSWPASAGSASAQVTAFVGGRLIDGTGRVIENGTLVIDGGRIVAAGPGGINHRTGWCHTRGRRRARRCCPAWSTPTVTSPRPSACARTRPSYTRENLTRQLRTYAQYGVTTVFSLGDDQAAGFRAARRAGHRAARPRPAVRGRRGDHRRHRRRGAGDGRQGGRHEARPAQDSRRRQPWHRTQDAGAGVARGDRRGAQAQA